MNWQILLQLFKGKNIYATIGKVLGFGGAAIAGIDGNNTGTDDLVAQIMLAGSDGLEIYANPNIPNDQKIRVIDSIIVALNSLRNSLTNQGSGANTPTRTT